MNTRKEHSKSDGSLNGGDDHGEAADDDCGEHVQDREDQVHPDKSNAGEQKQNLGELIPP